jgi:hypothetical protein
MIHKNIFSVRGGYRASGSYGCHRTDSADWTFFLMKPGYMELNVGILAVHSIKSNILRTQNRTVSSLPVMRRTAMK